MKGGNMSLEQIGLLLQELDNPQLTFVESMHIIKSIRLALVGTYLELAAVDTDEGRKMVLAPRRTAVRDTEATFAVRV